MADRALCVFTHDRPVYLENTLRSIAQLEDLDWYDLWIVVDGPVLGAGKDAVARIERVAALADAVAHPHKTVVKHTTNQGVGRVTWDTYNRLFESGYEQCVFVEDDVLLAPASLCILDVLRQRERQPGIYGLFTPCQLRTDEKVQRLGAVRDGAEFVCVSIDRVAWEQIAPIWGEYTQKFLPPGSVYRKRDHPAIRRWFAELLGRDVGNMETSRDGAIRAACEKVGVRIASTEVNHVLHIGEYGEHMTPALYKTLKHDVTNLDVLPMRDISEALLQG